MSATVDEPNEAPAGGAPSPIRRRRLVVVAGVVVVALLAAAVGGGMWLFGASPPPACEVQRSGFDVALEALVPRTFEGRGPDRLDSGEHCTAASLGTLHDRHSLASVEFAGGLWDLAPQTGVTLAVFRADGLQADWIAEFYQAGADQASKVTGFTVTHPTVDGSPATRFDYADAEIPQTIVVWPAPQPGLVRVVLAAGVPDRIVQEGIAAFR